MAFTCQEKRISFPTPKPSQGPGRGRIGTYHPAIFQAVGSIWPRGVLPASAARWGSASHPSGSEANAAPTSTPICSWQS